MKKKKVIQHHRAASSTPAAKRDVFHLGLMPALRHPVSVPDTSGICSPYTHFTDINTGREKKKKGKAFSLCKHPGLKIREMQEIASAGNQRQCEAFAVWATLMLKEFKHTHYPLQGDSSTSLATQHFVCDLLRKKSYWIIKKKTLNAAIYIHASIFTQRH